MHSPTFVVYVQCRTHESLNWTAAETEERTSLQSYLCYQSGMLPVNHMDVTLCQKSGKAKKHFKVGSKQPYKWICISKHIQIWIWIQRQMETNWINDFRLFRLVPNWVCMHINWIFEHSSNGCVHTTETVEWCFGLSYCYWVYVIHLGGKVNILGKYLTCWTQDILKCKMFWIKLHCIYVILHETCWGNVRRVAHNIFSNGKCRTRRWREHPMI